MKEKIFDYSYLLGIAGVVLIADQWTKSLVRIYIPLGQLWSPWSWLTPYARLVHWKNTGAAFGMLPGLSMVFTVLAIIVSLVILYYFPQVPRKDWPLRLAMGLQLGGAVGNLIDRLTQGYVTDFISVGSFPVFNIADASISIGVAVLILGMWWMEHKQSRVDQEADGERETETLPPPKWEGPLSE